MRPSASYRPGERWPGNSIVLWNKSHREAGTEWRSHAGSAADQRRTALGRRWTGMAAIGQGTAKCGLAGATVAPSWWMAEGELWIKSGSARTFPDGPLPPGTIHQPGGWGKGVKTKIETRALQDLSHLRGKKWCVFCGRQSVAQQSPGNAMVKYTYVWHLAINLISLIQN